jgi:hypothetical protein
VPRQVTLQSAGVTFDFPGDAKTGLWRELAVRVDSLRGGGSALRADAQAGWLEPRPTAERLPAGVERVQVTTTAPHGGHSETRTASITSHQQIASLVPILNSLPVAQRPGPRCAGVVQAHIRYAFYAGSSSPAAVALFNASCGRIQMVIGGRRWPDLELGLPNGDLFGAAAELRKLVTFGAGFADGAARRTTR